MLMRTFAAALLAAASLHAQTSPDDLVEAGHFKRLRALVATRNPNDAETLYLTAILKQAWNQLDEAEKLAERAVAANPKDARYHFRLAEIAGIKAEHAGVLHQVGLARKFKKEAEATLAIDPNHVRALDMMMTFHLMAPGIVGGDKAKARAMADQLMKIDPVAGYHAQLTLARSEKQPDRSDELLHKAVEVRPASYDARMGLGSWCANQKKFEEAERHAREAIRIHPDRAGAHALLAAVLVHQGRWNDLDTVLAQAEKDDPDNFYPYFRAANNCLALKQELPRAERYFRKYLSQEPEAEFPNLAATHWRLALVLEQQNRKPEAISELQTALKLDPNSPAKSDLKRLR